MIDHLLKREEIATCMKKTKTIKGVKLVVLNINSNRIS